MTNDEMVLRSDIAERLAEIDSVAEHVAIDSPANSNVETLAYVIHDLISCIRDLHQRSDSPPPDDVPQGVRPEH